MNKNKRTVLGMAGALLLGIAIGYRLKGKKKSKQVKRKDKAKVKKSLLTREQRNILEKSFIDLDYEDIDIIFKLKDDRYLYSLEDKDFIYRNILRIELERLEGEKENTSSKTEDEDEIVFRTKSGSKYHKETCSNLMTKVEITLVEARSSGLSPCMICRPIE